MTTSPSAASPLAGLRVLVVDNDPAIRKLHARLLDVWQCEPYVAEGLGDDLLANARTLAREKRCQLALVDMRLRDDNDPRDWSGLELVRQLLPTEVVIVSGKGDWDAAAASVIEYGARNFVGKEAGAERLQSTLIAVAKKMGVGTFRPRVVWSPGISSDKIRMQFFENHAAIPEDEAEEVIARLFHDSKGLSEQRIVLSPITDALHPSRVTALRRRSVIFSARVNQQLAYRVVKLAHKKKVQAEIHNYETYVQYGIRDPLRPNKHNHVILWDMGAIAYTYIGTDDMASNDSSQTFKKFYQKTADIDTITRPLTHFFGLRNWGNWYTIDVEVLETSLFDAYDRVWGNELYAAFERWRAHPHTRRFALLNPIFLNPTRWLADNYEHSQQVEQPRTAITHGDLHGDNLFVRQSYSWPIDFERTGPGPILRDFVELIQDILTRIALFTDSDLPVFYELAIAICDPSRPDLLMRSTAAIEAHPEARKAFQVAQSLQQLAYERARYSDRREYLWGLLLNNLYVATILPEDDTRRSRILLLASLICQRLERWSSSSPWLPADWPQVTWVDQPAEEKQPSATHAIVNPVAPATIADNKTSGAPEAEGSGLFSHGYGLLIGVGGDLPATVTDAEGLHDILIDPARCAYPPAQLRLLTGAQATRQQILAGLDWLAEQAAADSEATVMVYYSGHGVEAPHSYMLSHGWQLGNLAATALSGAEFSAKLRTIAARRLLVLLDCCHAGGMAEAKGELAKSPLPAEIEGVLSAGSGRVVIASSRRDELSYTGVPYSIFTQALREGLAGYGAAEHDGRAYIADIALYVGRVVPQRTKEHQHPILKLAAADNFAVAFYAGGTPAVKALP